MDGLCLKPGIIIGIQSPITVVAEARPSRRTSEKRYFSLCQRSSSKFSITYSLRPLWPETSGGNDTVSSNEARELIREKDEEMDEREEEIGDLFRNENWVMKILRVRSLWKEGDRKVANEVVGELDRGEEGLKHQCDDCKADYDEKIEFDKDTFSKLLRRVTLAEARMYARFSYLCTLAYSIPQIKPGILLKKHGFRFVTSSLEKKAEQALKAEKDKVSNDGEEAKHTRDVVERKEGMRVEYQISASTAYRIAASAASYLHSHTKSLLPFNSSLVYASKGSHEGESVNLLNTEVASLMATTDSLTAVVAAKEEAKQAVADDLNSTSSSPCDWFVCDDDKSCNRYFVIQGSESLASWQANLLFEPVQFEGLDVIVHRGIYEAAKGVYEQMLPEVQSHLKNHGSRATFRFTGHSLGGSLSLLVNLMLLIRGIVPGASLLPVITFGAPSVMCGGDRLLRQLGLPRSHLQAITMHRDIVPRAFSCSYPNRVAELLKAINGKFRNHPCLVGQKLLYAPMGEFLILQPGEKHSPNHHLLPSGSGLYLLIPQVPDGIEAERKIRAARSLFLNSPHPLEILKDRSSYGSEGTIQRDHDMNSYLKSVRSVIGQELSNIRKARKERRGRLWWPLLGPTGINANLLLGRHQMDWGNHRSFSSVIQAGSESLKGFSRVVASQRLHLLFVLLLPIVGACRMIRLF